MDKSWAGQWSHPHNTQDSLSGSCAAEATRLQQGQQYLPSLPSSPPSHTPQDFMSKSGCPRCGGPAQSLPPTLAECPDLLWSLCDLRQTEVSEGGSALLRTRLAAAHQPAQPRCAAPAESSLSTRSGKPHPYRWALGLSAGVLGAQAWVDTLLYRSRLVGSDFIAVARSTLGTSPRIGNPGDLSRAHKEGPILQSTKQ